MRDIKFRCWSKKDKIMWWWNNPNATNKYIRFDFDLEIEVEADDSILMQYTGLKDKNGKEIYEGDVCRNELGEIGKIVYTNAQFVSWYLPPHNWDPMQPCDGIMEKQEVIGNIYENPELLKKEV